MDEKVSIRLKESRKEVAKLQEELQKLISEGLSTSPLKNVENNSQTSKSLSKITARNIDNDNATKDVEIAKQTEPKIYSRANVDKTQTKSVVPPVNKTKNEAQRQEAREYMRRQREKRFLANKVGDAKKIEKEIVQKNLQELNDKAHKLLSANLQHKRERSKSREKPTLIIAQNSAQITKTRNVPDVIVNIPHRARSREINKQIPEVPAVASEKTNTEPLQSSSSQKSKNDSIKNINFDRKDSVDHDPDDTLNTVHRMIQIDAKISSEDSKKSLGSVKNDAKLNVPLFLQTNERVSNPHNFINSVKRKLNIAVKSKSSNDVAVQNSIEDASLKTPKRLRELKELISKSLGSERVRSNLNSKRFEELENELSKNERNKMDRSICSDKSEIKILAGSLSHEGFNSKNIHCKEKESDSDTSKNIPDLSSESESNKPSRKSKKIQNLNINFERGVTTHEQNLLKLPTAHLKLPNRKSPDLVTSPKVHRLKIPEKNLELKAEVPEDTYGVYDKVLSNSFGLKKPSIDNLVCSSTKLTNSTESSSKISSGTVENVVNFDVENIKTVDKSVLDSVSSSVQSNSKKVNSNSVASSFKSLYTNTDPYSTNFSVHTSTSYSNVPSLKHPTVSLRRSEVIHEVLEVSDEVSCKTANNAEASFSTAKRSNEISCVSNAKHIKEVSYDSNVRQSNEASYVSKTGHSYSSKNGYEVCYTPKSVSCHIVSHLSKIGDGNEDIYTPKSKNSREIDCISNENNANVVINSENLNKNNVLSNADRLEVSHLLNHNDVSFLSKAENEISLEAGNANPATVKFEADWHLLNDFNESMRRCMEVQKSLLELQTIQFADTITQHNGDSTFFETKDTQTSICSSNNNKNNFDEELSKQHINRSNALEIEKHPTINYSRADNDNDRKIIEDLTMTSKFEITNDNDFELKSLNFDISQTIDSSTMDSVNDLASVRENIESGNIQVGLSLKMFDHLIKEEDARIENLKAVLRIREKALLDRYKGELAWLNIQMKHYKETDQLREMSMIKKRQRGLIIKLQHETQEMQRLKQGQKQASKERKIFLKQQRNMIKEQLSNPESATMVSKIKKANLSSKERQSTGPLKVYNVHTTESIRSETSLSKQSSMIEEIVHVTSHTQSIVISDGNSTEVEEISNQKNVAAISTERNKLEVAKKTLLMRESVLQKRRQAAEELLLWHQRLLEEERRVAELEMAASSIINQVHASNVESLDGKVHNFKGEQLNILWQNMTGREEKKFEDSETYPFDQSALRKFCSEAKGIMSDRAATKTSETHRKQLEKSSSLPENRSICLEKAKSTTEHSSSVKNTLNRQKSVPEYDENTFNSEIATSLSINKENSNKSPTNESIKDSIKLVEPKTSVSDNLQASIVHSIEPKVSDEPKLSSSDHNTSISEQISTDSDSTQRILTQNDTNIVSISKKDDKIKQQTSESIMNTSIVENIPILNKNTENLNSAQSIDEDLVLNKSISRQTTTENVISKLDSLQNNENERVTSEIIAVGSVLSNIEKELAPNIGELKLKSSLLIDSPVYINEVFTRNDGFAQSIDKSINIDDYIEQNVRIVDGNSTSFEKDLIFKSSTIESVDELVTNKVSINKLEVDNETVSNECLDLTTSQRKDIRIDALTQTESVHIENNVEETDSPQNNIQSIENNSKTLENIISEQIITNSVTENVILSKDSNVESSQHIIDTPSLSKKSSDVIETERSNSILSEKSKLTSNKNASDSILSVQSDPFQNQLVLAENKTKSDFVDSIPNNTDSTQCTENIASNENKASDLENNVNSTLQQSTVENEVANVEKSSSDETIATESSIIKSRTISPPNISYGYVENNREIQLENEEIPSTKSEDNITNLNDVKDRTEKINKVVNNCIEENAPTLRNNQQSENNVSIKENLDVENESPDVTSQLTNYTMTTFEDEPVSIEAKNVEISSTSEKVSLSSNKSKSSSSKKSQISSEKSKSKSQTAENLSQKSASSHNSSIDVKKRVSEILADTHSPRDKSPRIQDVYCTTFDVASPEHSPEPKSPVVKYGHEAEELFKKQLAIEQEIKQLELQQKEQIPYMIMRDIPNKPPPPYTPPTSLQTTVVPSVLPSAPEEVDVVVENVIGILYTAYLNNTLQNVTISEETIKFLINGANIDKNSFLLAFNLCKEATIEHYRQFEVEKGPVWMKVTKKNKLAVAKACDKNGLEKLLKLKVKQLLGFEKVVRKENMIMKWSRKKRDHVDELLVTESQLEESEWTNYDHDERVVMRDLTDDIMNMLIVDAGADFVRVLQKKGYLC